MCKECLHILAITSKNENDFSGKIFYFCKKEIKDLAASVILSGNKLISLINEQRSATTVANFFKVLFATRNSIAPQSRAGCFDEQVTRNNSYRTQELGIEASDGGFP
jgi:hypothetical protein